MEKKKNASKSLCGIDEKSPSKKSLTIEQLLAHGFDDSNIKKRFIRISGKAETVNQEKKKGVSVYLQTNRQRVEQDQKGNWYCSLKGFNPHRSLSLQILNSSNEIEVNLASLLTVSFSIDEQGYAIPAYPKENDDHKNVLSEIFTDEPNWDKTISSSGSSLNWEARLSVVQKYTDIVNSHTRRKKEFELKELIKHWREKLLLPIELATDLNQRNTQL